MREWLQAPLPSYQTPAQDVTYLVLDIEMTGLEVREHQMVSLGWVKVVSNKVVLSSAQHIYINTGSQVGQSATIHQIRDVELEQGVSEQEAMSLLLQASSGSVLVFHHAYLDRQFLNRALRRLFSAPLVAPVVDTLELEKRYLERTQTPIEPGSLRLGACRDRYGLPQYQAHNALVDAVATAELLLAIIARKKKSRLSELISGF